MESKILVIKGSPRANGNSSVLAEQVVLGAQAVGAQVDSYRIAMMNIQPCNACDLCQELDEGCTLDDDMQTLYPKLLEADGIVLASPVYWFTFCAQMKLFIDRWYALEGPEGSRLRGKRFGLVMTYGDSDPYNSGAVNAFHTFHDILRYLHGDFVGIVYGSASAIGDIQNQQEVLEQAYNLGKMLVETR